ncbi:MAG: hypothetical protein JJU33_13945 [Phycisphaerales bacterium]|nr:hypothetical protein [Phycisphaerales bacterium]
MKLSWIVAAAAAAAVTSSSLAATIVNIGRVSGYHESRIPGTNNTIGGGEFTVTGTGAGLRGLGSDINNNSFQTFCLELDQFLGSGARDYAVQINTTIITGSPGVAFVSQGTAWLYNQFRGGNLTGYNYTVGAGRASSASSLQLAIWFLQGQFDDPTVWAGGNTTRNSLLWTEFNNNQDAQDFFDLVDGMFGSNAFDPYTGNRVRALNVGPTPNGGNWQNQDLLTLIPLPSGGGLAAAGLLGLVALRRRRA